MNLDHRRFRNRLAASVIFTFCIMAFFGIFSVAGAFGQESESARQMGDAEADVAKFGLIAAAIAFGFGAIGAGIAIAHVGAAAMGTIGERPELASQALIFIALAEGLVVFGFITALMILGKF